MFLNVLIVEDNDLFINSNVRYIKALSKKYNVGVKIKVFSHVGNTLKTYIQENVIDVALLDIEIGNNSGISIGKCVLEYQPFASLIFITFYKKYMEKANVLDPAGFIEKPVDFTRLDKIFCKIVMAKVGKNTIEINNARIITFKQNRKDVEIRENEIIYIKTYERKLFVQTKKWTMTVNSTLLETKEKLSDLFVQVSRDILVNKHEVAKLEMGKLTVSNGDELDIPLSRFHEISKKIRS